MRKVSLKVNVTMLKTYNFGKPLKVAGTQTEFQSKSPATQSALCNNNTTIAVVKRHRVWKCKGVERSRVMSADSSRWRDKSRLIGVPHVGYEGNGPVRAVCFRRSSLNWTRQHITGKRGISQCKTDKVTGTWRQAHDASSSSVLARTGLTVGQALSCNSELRCDIIHSLITADAIIVALQLEIHTRWVQCRSTV